MRLGAKMLVGPVLVTAVALGASLVHGWNEQREVQRASAQTQANNERRDAIARSREELSQVRGEVYRSLVLLSSMDDKQIKAARDDLAQRVKAVQQQLASLAAANANDAELGAIALRIAGHLTDFAKRCDKAIDLSGMDPNIGAASMNAADDSFKGLSKELQALVARLHDQASVAESAAQARQQSLKTVLALALLLAGIGCVAAAWRIRNRVVRQLHSAVALCEDAAQGRLASAGTQIHSAGGDEIGDLQRALGRMVQALSASLITVRDATEQINTASAEIASGNLDLSQRTEQSASSLQRTATAMEELTGTVTHTADSARNANQLAASASDVARRGGTAVTQVVNTMQEINASSRRIADIISTIDGIAFQTNILALNAAVEAARAGEQGRGFAVVASEVRSLAQRSAAAAREIKTLIGASLERVEAGTQQVASAGSTMDEIVASVQRVSDIIGEITTATAEQSNGIGQVNGSVADLDTMTQQNAALVEQSAAAAESLRQQARLLADVVGRFELGRSAAAELSDSAIAKAKSAARPAGASAAAVPSSTTEWAT
jgi:methyl-accepting chemotaxis protein